MKAERRLGANKQRQGCPTLSARRLRKGLEPPEGGQSHTSMIPAQCDGSQEQEHFMDLAEALGIDNPVIDEKG